MEVAVCTAIRAARGDVTALYRFFEITKSVWWERALTVPHIAWSRSKDWYGPRLDRTTLLAFRAST